MLRNKAIYYYCNLSSPYIYDGELVFRNTCEQKVIFKNYRFSDYYMAEVDIMPLVKKGRIDCGFYLQATEATSKLDGIKALLKDGGVEVK